jgi:hypothetical protein
MERIDKFIEEGLKEVKWISYASNCEVERKKVSDLLEEAERKHRIEVIKGQIDVYHQILESEGELKSYECFTLIEELQQQLEQLEDGK